MGLFRRATSINTLAWLTPINGSGCPRPTANECRRFGLSGWAEMRGAAPWRRDAKWERNYEAWMAHAVSTLR